MKQLFLIVLLVGVVACTPDEAPSTPKDLQITPGDQKLSVQWKANPEGDIASYLLSWRNALTNQSQSKSIAAPSTNTVLEGLANDTSYLVSIAAVDKAGQKSAPTTPIIGSPKAPPVVDQPPTKPTGLIATAQDAQVALNWTPNPEVNLKLYRIRYGTSDNNLDKTLSIDAPATSVVVLSLNNNTAYFFALEAENSKGLVSPRSDIATATPKATPQAPVVQEVTITDYGLSNQVRQGVGSIELVIKGLNLDTLKSATLGSYALSVKAKAATEATLEASIPHGAPLGDLALSIENDVGSFSRPAAVEVTKITSASKPELSPSDTDGKGTPNRPFRTLTKALSVAQKGDTVLLTAGIYQTGETWPQVINNAIPTQNVPDGVSIEGQSSDRGAVLLQGPGKEQEFGGLVFSGNATVRNLTVRGFKYAMVHEGNAASPSGQIALQNVASSSNFDGLHIRFAKTLSIRDSSFNNNSASGLYMVGAFKATLHKVTSSKNLLGLLAEYGPDLEASQLTLSENTSDGLILNRASASITASEAINNSGHGLNYTAENQGQRLVLRSSLVIGNKGHGIWVRGFPQNVAIGIAGDDPDLMQVNQSGLSEIHDERQANTGNNNFFFVKARIRNALVPDSLVGPGSEPAGVKIVNPGNVIRFNVL